MNKNIRYKKIAQKEDLSQNTYKDFSSEKPDQEPLEDFPQANKNNTQQSDFSHPSITGFEEVSKIYNYILEQSKKLNMRPLVILNSMDLQEPLKSKLSALVHIYQENELNESSWTAADLKTATDKARFFTEEWNKIIEDAKAQQMDVGIYISTHYPQELAQQIYYWYQIKTGQITPQNLHEQLAVTVNEISNEEVEQYDQEYDGIDWENLVENAREALSEINWHKVGAYFSDGINNVLYQLSKPGSFIKKTADSIRAVASLLSLENVDEFSENYDRDQENRERAEQELDDYIRTSKMNKRRILASLNNIANSLDNSGMIREANTLTKVMKRLAEDEKMMTSYSEEELNNAMSAEGIQKAFEQYKSKGGSASQDSFASQWKPLIERMLNGFSNNMGVSIAEEKYKRKNPFWDPRD